MVVSKKKDAKTSVLAKLSRAERAVVIREIAASKLGGQTIVKVGRSHISGYLDFIREQGVIGLAVGLAFGTAAGASVKQIVDGIVSPIVGFIIGGIDLSQQKWVVVGPGAGGKGGLVLSWGAVVSSLITLLATALVIYWLVKIAHLDRVDKKKDDK